MPPFSILPASRSIPTLTDVGSPSVIRRRFTLSSGGHKPNRAAAFLQELLGHHRLPLPAQVNTSDCSAEEDESDEYIQPLTVRLPSSPSLLEQMHRSLCHYAKHLVPDPDFDQPWTEGTLRLSRLFQSLSEEAASATTPDPPSRNDLCLASYLSHYLLRPLNELIAYMLLPQGILLHWQAQEDPETCRFELVWTRGGLNPRQVRLAVMDGFAPHDLTVQDLQALAMSVRLGMMYVNSRGCFTHVCNPKEASFAERTPAAKMAGKLLAHMQDVEVPVAILTNCNQFMAVAKDENGKAEPVISFSEPVAGGEASKSMLASSQLGFLLSATTFAFQCHTKNMTAAELAGYTKLPMTLLLEIFTQEKFAAALGTQSHRLKARRRGMLSPEICPSHLGPTALSFYCSQVVIRDLGVHSPIWTQPFFGPYEPCTLPTLLEEQHDPDSWWTPQIELVALKGSGALWTAFSAKLRGLPLDRTDADLIVKFFVPSMFPEKRISKNTVYTRDEAKAAAMHELATYKGPLADLQGRLVPQLRGIFGSCQSEGVQVWCVMLDDAGDEIKPSERRSNWVQKSVRKVYTDLHAAGVIHGDVQWRHIRRLGMCKTLQLVDFDRAQLRSAGMSEEDWDDLTRMEMDCVEIMLECAIPCSPAKQDSTLRRNPSQKRRKPVPSFEPLIKA